MGIENIHILHEPDDSSSARRAQQVKEYTEAKRILEHQSGQHPYGSMRRDCPLCVSGK